MRCPTCSTPDLSSLIRELAPLLPSDNSADMQRALDTFQAELEEHERCRCALAAQPLTDAEARVLAERLLKEACGMSSVLDATDVQRLAAWVLARGD